MKYRDIEIEVFIACKSWRKYSVFQEATEKVKV